MWVPMSSPDREALLSGLSTVLWRERQLLELLLFKLVEEQMVLAAGADRWLPRATREVELVVEQVRVAELGREVEVGALTAALGVGGGVSLRELITLVEDPWPEILTKHREAFLELTREIGDAAEHNRELLHRAHAATRQALAWIEGGAPAEPATYTSAGAADTGGRGHHLLNWAI